MRVRPLDGRAENQILDLVYFAGATVFSDDPCGADCIPGGVSP
jgi:hypothetical protein